jgi:hypothetical protein
MIAQQRTGHPDRRVFLESSEPERLRFSVGSLPQHGSEDRAESCLSKLVQATAKCIVVEIVGIDPIVKEVLSVCSLEKSGELVQRLSFILIIATRCRRGVTVCGDTL